MARKPAIDDSDDISFEEPVKPSRKFGGDDDSPTDAETGETIFEDLTPRLRNVTVDDDLSEEEELEEEEEPEDEAEGEESEEGDDEPKSGSWNKRLARERRLREEAEANFADVQARLEKVEQTVNAKASDEEFTREKSALDAKIADVRTRLNQAKEDGETELETKLQEELTDLKIDLRAKTLVHEEAKKAIPPKGSGDTVVARKVGQWVRKHSRYNTDKVFAQFVKAVDQQLAGEGMNPETDAYYAELDKRIAERYPEEYKAEKALQGKRPKHPSQNFRQETGAGKRPRQQFDVRNGKVRLSKRQMDNMRMFQLDPTNPSDVREYYLNNK